MDDREVYLNNIMENFSKNIYQDLFELCEMEKNGKKPEKNYFIKMQDLKRLLDLENKFYRANIEEIYKCGWFINSLTSKKESNSSNGLFTYMSDFVDDAVNERIKTKLKHYAGIEKMVNRKKYHNTKLNYSESRDITDAYLDDMFLHDMQRVSMYYMEQSYPKDRAIDYKYLTSLVFNLDYELVNNYFIVHPEININSSLLYKIEGYYKGSYLMDSIEVLTKKFEDYIEYIDLIDSAEDADKDYKIDIALGYLKSILDLLPEDIEYNYKNDYVTKISNNEEMPQYLKERILEAINGAGKTRKLIRYVTLGEYSDWN